MERRIGFIGCYSHDIILMLAKTLKHMEKAVLVRDCNRRHILRVSVPLPDSISLEEEEAEYDGVYFTEKLPGSTAAGYEFELMDFGMEVNEEAVRYCTDWIVITDMLLHHIRQLEECGFPRERTRVCVIRDAFEDICMKEPEVCQLLGKFPNCKAFFLPPDFRDVKNRYVCETAHEYNVSRASPEMREMIFNVAGMLCTDWSERDIRKQVKRSERRRYR